MMHMIFRKAEAEYFSLEDWTNAIFFGFTKMICPTTPGLQTDRGAKCVMRFDPKPPRFRVPR
jgi:hypothetical protein